MHRGRVRQQVHSDATGLSGRLRLTPHVHLNHRRPFSFGRELLHPKRAEPRREGFNGMTSSSTRIAWPGLAPLQRNAHCRPRGASRFPSHPRTYPSQDSRDRRADITEGKGQTRSSRRVSVRRGPLESTFSGSDQLAPKSEQGPQQECICKR